MGNMKAFGNRVMRNKDALSIAMGIMSIAVPVVLIVTTLLMILAFYLIWLELIVGIFLLIWGIVDIMRTKRHDDHEENNASLHTQDISSLILMSFSFTILATILLLVFAPGFILIEPLVGGLLGLLGFIFGIIEYRNAKRQHKKGIYEKNKKYAYYGIICSIIGILLQIIFVIVVVVLFITAVSLFLEMLSSMQSYFSNVS